MKQTIRHFFLRYAHAYNEQNLEAITSFFLLPSVMINTQRMAKFRVHDDLVQEYLVFFKYMTEHNMVQFDLIDLVVSELYLNQYVASVQWRVFNHDSQVQMEFGATYMLVLEEGVLKIATVMVHDKDKRLTLM